MITDLSICIGLILTAWLLKQGLMCWQDARKHRAAVRARVEEQRAAETCELCDQPVVSTFVDISVPSCRKIRLCQAHLAQTIAWHQAQHTEGWS